MKWSGRLGKTGSRPNAPIYDLYMYMQAYVNLKWFFCLSVCLYVCLSYETGQADTADETVWQMNRSGRPGRWNGPADPAEKTVRQTS